MPASPVEAEATGQEFVEATFSGTTFRVPLDVDSWPLDEIRSCRIFKPDTQEIVVDSAVLVTALQRLLGEQWRAFIAAVPKRGDLIPATHQFAAAAGIPASRPNDVAFGGIPRLLALINQWPNKVESDLNQFWHIDYRDRWRFDANGRRQLTLRQIHARLSDDLPIDSALAVALNGGKRPLSDTAVVVMDLYEQLTGQRHPSRPMPAEVQKARDDMAAQQEQARADYRKRQEERDQSLRKSLENAKTNARISQRNSGG